MLAAIFYAAPANPWQQLLGRQLDGLVQRVSSREEVEKQ